MIDAGTLHLPTRITITAAERNALSGGECFQLDVWLQQILNQPGIEWALPTADFPHAGDLRIRRRRSNVPCITTVGSDEAEQARDRRYQRHPNCRCA